MNTFTATLVEIAKRLVSFDKKLGVYVNGEDNNYPERVDRVINNSVTAKAAAGKFKKFIIGKGFEEQGLNGLIINEEKNLTLLDLYSKICRSFSRQNGVFLHANINANHKIADLDVLPFKWCRIGKKDDTKYHGKILVYDSWEDEKEVKKAIKSDKVEVIDVFNPLAKVIDAQVKKAGGWKKYKGQVYFINPDETIYPLAHIDGSAMNDADSEFRASTFKNISLRKGFFGKQVVITKPLLGQYAGEPDQLLQGEDLIRKRHAETGRDNFKKVLKSFIGAQNADGVLHLETEMEGDGVDSVIKFVTVDTNINDKLFAHTENSSANNIRKANQNIPSILIENSDHSIFGQSGELLQQAKIAYQEETEDERVYLASELTKIMTHFEGFKMPEGGLKVTPLIQSKPQPQPAE